MFLTKTSLVTFARAQCTPRACLLGLLIAAGCAVDVAPSATVSAPIRSLSTAEADELYARTLLAAAGNALSAQHEWYGTLAADPTALAETTTDLVETAQRVQSASHALAMVSPGSGPALEDALLAARCYLDPEGDRYCQGLDAVFTFPSILCFDPAAAAAIDPASGLSYLPRALSTVMQLIKTAASEALSRTLGIPADQTVSCDLGNPGPLGPLHHPTDGRGDAFIWEQIAADGQTAAALRTPLMDAFREARTARMSLTWALGDELAHQPMLLSRAEPTACTEWFNALAEPVLRLTSHATPTLLEELTGGAADPAFAVQAALGRMTATIDCARDRIEDQAQRDLWALSLQLTRMPGLVFAAEEVLAVMDPEADDRAVFGDDGALGRAYAAIERDEWAASFLRVMVFSAAIVTGVAVVAGLVLTGLAAIGGTGALLMASVGGIVSQAAIYGGAATTVGSVVAAIDSARRLGWAATAAHLTGSYRARRVYLAARRRFIAEATAAALNVAATGLSVGLPRLLRYVARYRGPMLDGKPIIADLPVEAGMFDDPIVQGPNAHYRITSINQGGMTVPDVYRELAKNPFTSRLVRTLWREGELSVLGFTNDIGFSSGGNYSVAGGALVNSSFGREQALQSAAHELTHFWDDLFAPNVFRARDSLSAAELSALAAKEAETGLLDLVSDYIELRQELRASRVGALASWQRGTAMTNTNAAVVAATEPTELFDAWTVASGLGYRAEIPHLGPLREVVAEAAPWWFLMDPTLDEFWTLSATAPGRGALVFDVPMAGFPLEVLPVGPRDHYLCPPPGEYAVGDGDCQ